MKKLSRKLDMGDWDWKRKSGQEGLVRSPLSLGHNTTTQSRIQDRPKAHLFLVDSFSGPVTILCSLKHVHRAQSAPGETKSTTQLDIFQGHWYQLSVSKKLMPYLLVRDHFKTQSLSPLIPSNSLPSLFSLVTTRNSNVSGHPSSFRLSPHPALYMPKCDFITHTSLILSPTSSETHGLHQQNPFYPLLHFNVPLTFLF